MLAIVALKLHYKVGTLTLRFDLGCEMREKFDLLVVRLCHLGDDFLRCPFGVPWMGAFNQVVEMSKQSSGS